jgi:hypothetical protein
MKTNHQTAGSPRFACVALVLLVAAFWLLPARSQAQTMLTLANPHWNITLSDFGYSDFLLDNTPGFEGREYLSGEWGAAVGYHRTNGTIMPPRFLDPMFLFPDWPTLSTFDVKTAMAQTGLNVDNLPIAQSVITNAELEITLRVEMLDTVVGTPMGTTPASAGGTGLALDSSRYVMKQTATLRNISGTTLTNVQFFQFLHGLNAERGFYDNRSHTGALDTFRHDLTLAGVDSNAVTTGSSSAGLEDFITFHSTVVPSAFEIGHYGIEGNGVDDHFSGKPTDGVHRSVEANWLVAPYAAREGTDHFAPSNRWVSGAQRWNLGTLAPNQSASHDVLLSIRTGTRVPAGTIVSGGCNGGSSVPGGLDYEFEDVSSDGSCFGEFSLADDDELAARIAGGEFTPLAFPTPGGPAQLWQVQFSGTFTGHVHLIFGYDPTVLPPGFNETTLTLREFSGGAWHELPAIADPFAHTLGVTVTNLGAFALAVAPLVSYVIDATVSPPNSGTITGTNTYGDGSIVTLVATAAAGYVFVNWTEGGTPASTSPGYTFTADSDRTLVANFIPVGAAKSITTSSSPAAGGSTSGDGAYAAGASATVSATPNYGYKFSKWQVNGLTVSSAANYTFTVSTNRALVAKFKPVYYVEVSANPPEGGEVEADPAYELGELAKLKAKPSEGWSFVNWTQNGVPVSASPQFQFNVTGNRTLVGNFAWGHRVDLAAEPVNGGNISGAGIYPPGQSVFLEAIAHPGYVFLNWTENGGVVSTDPFFTFTSTMDHALVANFIAQPSLLGGTVSPGAMTFSWPAGGTGWVLQECSDLGTGTWTNSTRTVTTENGQNRVSIAPGAGHGFFRLAHP